MSEQHVPLGELRFAWESVKYTATEAAQSAKKEVDTSNFTAPDVFGERNKKDEDNSAKSNLNK